MSNNEELIWVEKDFAAKYQILHSEQGKNEERIAALDEYINKIKEQSRSNFKANLESLEEDVAIYTGLMLKVKQAFGKAKDEQLNVSYELWEKFDKDIPSVKEKVDNIVSTLDPLQKKLETINALLGKIRTYEMDKVIESVEKLSSLYGKQKDMIDFLVSNFKEQEPTQ